MSSVLSFKAHRFITLGYRFRTFELFPATVVGKFGEPGDEQSLLSAISSLEKGFNPSNQI